MKKGRASARPGLLRRRRSASCGGLGVAARGTTTATGAAAALLDRSLVGDLGADHLFPLLLLFSGEDLIDGLGLVLLHLLAHLRHLFRARPFALLRTFDACH